MSKSSSSAGTGAVSLAIAQLRADHLVCLLTLAAASVVSAALVSRNGGFGPTVMAAIFLASILSSIAGFAFSAVCGAMLFHLAHEPVRVIQIMMTCSIANQATMTWAARRDIDWRGLGVFLAGGALGLGFGVWVLLHADCALYIQALGVFLLLYGATMLFRTPMVLQRQRTILDFGIGVVGGITGGAAAFPGMPVTIWCSMKGWGKTRQRAMLQPFILIMQVAALLVILVARTSGPNHIGFPVADLLFVPASLLGTSLGLMLYKRLSDTQFARAINILLIVSGLSFVV